MKLVALVVLFKVDPEASESLLSLAAQRGAVPWHLVVWDNSPAPCSIASRDWLSKNFADYDYHSCPENFPLSRIYDQIICTLIKERPGRFTHLLLLDQDSGLDSEFLCVAGKAVEENPTISLFLPLVQANGIIVSPGRLFYFKGFYMRSPRPGPIRLRFKAAINSGMLIASSYLFKDFPGYPKELAFYGTDNWFCEQYAKDEKVAFVINSTIRHDLSRFKVESADLKLWRHREQIRADRIINSHGVFRRYGCLLYTFLTCARMALRFRDRRFLSC
jgi:GT2 family glycosyltransferase